MCSTDVSVLGVAMDFAIDFAMGVAMGVAIDCITVLRLTSLAQVMWIEKDL